tara:strand:- start:187 stop:387 length:201 start_codon:yes stop_codon:yes gene_type:complete
MTSDKKFSELIINLTEVWLHWVRNNSVCRDKTQSVSVRKKAADKCEYLIKREYQIVNDLDSFFDNE